MTIVAEQTKPAQGLSVLFLAERWYIDKRLDGLVRFALGISIVNILGHFWLGFEQSWATPFVALAAAYGTELTAESVQAIADKRRPRFAGSPGQFIAFLLPAHISGLVVGMLLFAAEQLWIIAFGASLAIASKWLFRARLKTPGGGFSHRHFLNPSNFGITVVVLLFPSVGIAPPYMFTENTSGIVDWLLPLSVIIAGSLLNAKLTGRMPLAVAWIAAFACQGILRALLNGTPVIASLVPMTGFAFWLFTFYMITDPATTPTKLRRQFVFGMSVAGVYGLLMQEHIAFGFFYALTIVTIIRGTYLWFASFRPARMAIFTTVQDQIIRDGRPSSSPRRPPW